MEYVFRCREIYPGDGIPFDGYIRISEGKITEVGLNDPETVQGAVFVDATKYKIIPGLIDLHVHGYMGEDVASADVHSVLSMSSRLAAEGTTSFLPTLGAMPVDCIDKVTETVKSVVLDRANDGAEVLGLHLEGPFLNPCKQGAMRRDYLLNPSLDLAARWLESVSYTHLLPQRDSP